MAGNTFGSLFRVTTFGESHGGAVGAVVDGSPPGIEISEEDIQKDLDRRKPGQSKITTPRSEKDTIHVLSGVFEGKTTGTPILLVAYNNDTRPQDYNILKTLFRPGHADFTYTKKYGIRDWRGSGRASARETLGRVAAGAIAKKFLKTHLGIEILSYVDQVETIRAHTDFNKVTLQQIEQNIVRCPDNNAAKRMIRLIESVKNEGDSVGGVIRGVIKNVPVGLGEPAFDKLPALLSHAMMSINAVKGFDIGLGFESVKLRGSQHNDEFLIKNGKPALKTNNAGGTLGGISNGQTIYFRVAIKPVSTIKKKQNTITTKNKTTQLEADGRHDPCVLPRAVPIVDAMSAITIMDLYLANKAQNT